MMTNNVSFNRNVSNTINCMLDVDDSLESVLNQIDKCVRYEMLRDVPASRVGTTVVLTHTDAIVACMHSIDALIERSVRRGTLCLTE